MTRWISLGCLAMILSGCGKPGTGPFADSGGAVSPQSYVGSERCGECHGPELPAAFAGTYHADWLATAHGQAGQMQPSTATIVADSDQDGRNDFQEALDLALVPEWQAFSTLAPRLSQAAGRFLVTLGGRSFEVEKVLGMGRHQQTYLTRIGRSLYVLPLLYQRDSHSWDPILVEHWYTWNDLDASGTREVSEPITGVRYAAPADTPVSRGRTADCFEVQCSGCHVTGIRSLQRTPAGEFVLDHAEDGVGCEACHGPGKRHADSAGESPIDSQIVDPTEISVDLHNDLCVSCHARGISAGNVSGQTLEFPWHPEGRPYLPGEVLSDSFQVQEKPREPVHRLQGNVLHASLPGSAYGDWNQTCQDCHSAHNTLNLALIRMAIAAPDGSYRFTELTSYAGAPGSAGVLGDAGNGSYTDACEVCHSQTSYFRDDASTPFTDHFNGQDCRVCHSHSEGFQRSGTPPGGLDCAICHRALVDEMTAPVRPYRHQIQASTATYPDASDPLECLSCHVDHDLLDSDETTRFDAANLRADIGTLPTAASDAVATDFLATGSGGICLSCHTQAWAKSSVRPDGSTVVDLVPFAAPLAEQLAAYQQSAHGGDYALDVSFRDSSAFVSNCGKCHRQAGPGSVDAPAEFAAHDSDHAALLATLGHPGFAVCAEETFCYRCHAEVGDPVGGIGKAGAQLDWYGQRAMSGRSERLYSELQAPHRHDVGATLGAHTSGEGQSPLWSPVGSRHVECADCHNTHASPPSREFQFDGTFLQPVTPSNLAAANPMAGVWGVDVTWPLPWTTPDPFTAYQREEISTYTWQVCLKCHSSYAYGNSPPAGQTDQALEFNPGNAGYHAVIGPSRTTYPSPAAFVSPWARDSAMNCGDCHTSDDPAAAQGPHGSTHQGLLAGAYDETTGQSGTQDHLCFKCHAFNVYGRGNGSGRLTGFAKEGKENLHTEHARQEHFQANRDCTCFDCHSAVPHGFDRRAMLIVQEDPAPYNNGAAGNVAADIAGWPAPGQWLENSCSTSPCHD